jgi:glycosyltransferase involved in cell wall biosynthesis
MRVLVTSPVWSLNGVNTFSSGLVRRLRERGIDASLLLTGVDWRDGKPLPLPDDVPVESLRLPVWATWPARWSALREHLERSAPCLYLPNHDVQHSGIAPLLSSRVGIVGIAHSDDAQHYAHARRVGRWWNAAVGVSETITRTLRGFDELANVRIAHIPYGVDVAPDDSGANHEPDPAPFVLRVFYAGRLEPLQKRSPDLIAIARALRAGGTTFLLTIAGEGPSRVALEAEVRSHSLERQVRFLGTVAPGEVAALCRAHHAFVLPSAYEGLPIALLEAMGQGCIPVASDVASGIPELVDDGVNGFRVPVGDVAAFAGRLASLAREPATRRAMSSRARCTIADRGLRAADVTDRYQALFEGLWKGVASGRFVRPPGGFIEPPGLGWRARVRAPLARWRDAIGVA